jgi:cold shock CspA family protein
VIRTPNHPAEPIAGQIVYFGNVKEAPDPDHRRSASSVLVDLDAVEDEGLERLAIQGELRVLLTLTQFIQHTDFTPYLDKAVDQQLSKGNLAIILQHKERLRGVLHGKSSTMKSVIVTLSPIMTSQEVFNCVRELGLGDEFANCGRVDVYFPAKHFGFIVDIQTGESLFFRDSSIRGLEDEVLLEVGLLVKYDAIEENPQYPRRLARSLAVL